MGMATLWLTDNVNSCLIKVCFQFHKELIVTFLVGLLGAPLTIAQPTCISVQKTHDDNTHNAKLQASNGRRRSDYVYFRFSQWRSASFPSLSNLLPVDEPVGLYIRLTQSLNRKKLPSNLFVQSLTDSFVIA